MESISELRERCQGSKRGGDYPSAYVRFGRKYSIYLTWLLLRTPLSANHVTLLGIGIGLIGAILLAMNNATALVAGVVLLQVSYILDFSDGEIARYKSGGGSLSGAYLDFLYHYYVPILYMGMLTIGAYQAAPHLGLLLLGLLSCAGVSQLHFFCKEHIIISHLRHEPETVTHLAIQEAMKDNPNLMPGAPESTGVSLRDHVNRFTRFIGELLLYPYAFNVITLVVAADILMSWGHAAPTATFRTGFVALSAVLLSLQTLKRVRYNFLVLRNIDRK